ncbi:hypothetical protein [Clostridium botulinum]|uniref:hypothetical protein n=1 Tax=Clostridium botulinum TaxID=1491 RepID=UPI000AA2527D|nr:hypothetical protein [Clostridium botulinum]
MNKTDKELAVELTSNFLASWNSNQHAGVIQSDSAVNIFNNFYKAIHDKKDDE